MSDESGNFWLWHVELSDRETFLIGRIIAQWGALEYEVFHQTLRTFDAHEDRAISFPRTMNNLQFTGVLEEWKERVVDRADGECGKVLHQQYDEIVALYDYRNALIHGMWEWSSAELHKITTVRVRKNEVIRTHFSADDLEDCFHRVASINFNIRFPGGREAYAEALSKAGGHMSRQFLASVSGSPVASDWLPNDGHVGDKPKE